MPQRLLTAAKSLLPEAEGARRWLVAAAVVVALLAPVGQLAGQSQPPAPTTRSSGSGALEATAVPPESWPGVARRLAESLVDPQKRAAEEPLFLPAAQVFRFGRATPATPASLSHAFDGWRILGVQALQHPHAHAAADTAGEVLRQRQQEPWVVPEVIARALTPRQDQLAASEQTATRWLTAALSAQPGDRVGIIVLWNPRQTERPLFERLAFLLVKSGRLPDGRFRIQTLRYGTAQEAAVDGY